MNSEIIKSGFVEERAQVNEIEAKYLETFEEYKRMCREYPNDAKFYASRVRLERILQDRDTKYNVKGITYTINWGNVPVFGGFKVGYEWNSGGRRPLYEMGLSYQSSSILIASSSCETAEIETNKEKEPIILLPSGFKLTYIEIPEMGNDDKFRIAQLEVPEVLGIARLSCNTFDPIANGLRISEVK